MTAGHSRSPGFTSVRAGRESVSDPWRPIGLDDEVLDSILDQRAEVGRWLDRAVAWKT